jgi:hypothetical protein
VSESRLERHVAALQKFYGPVPGPPRDPFTLFVWEIMSGHSTPRKRDGALAALKKIPALTPDAMWRAPQKKLEAAVATAGPYTEQRLLALRKGVDHFRRAPDLSKTIRGPVAPARRAIKGLPQMSGDGGAYRMLLFGADHAGTAGGRAAQPRRTAPGLWRRRAVLVVGAAGSRDPPGHRPGSPGGCRRLPPHVHLPVPPRRRDVHGSGSALPRLPAARRVSGISELRFQS